MDSSRTEKNQLAVMGSLTSLSVCGAVGEFLCSGRSLDRYDSAETPEKKAKKEKQKRKARV
jgi:hypothetical protein